jgi:hypothetical protein
VALAELSIDALTRFSDHLNFTDTACCRVSLKSLAAREAHVREGAVPCGGGPPQRTLTLSP